MDEAMAAYHCHFGDVADGIRTCRLTRNINNPETRLSGMQLEINDLPNFGVMVYGPDSGGFNNKLSSLVTIPADLAADVAKYSAIIENQTPQHIIAMEVIWRFYPSQGKVVTRTFGFSRMSNQFFDDASYSLIKAGELYPHCLFADCGGFSPDRMTTLKNNQQTTLKLDNVKGLMAISTRWSITIDSVLFSNGVWAGPNTDGHVERQTAQINGARDMLKELAQKLDAGEPVTNLLAHALAVSGRRPGERPDDKLPDGFREKMYDPNYLYGEARKQAALEALGRHEHFGGDKALIYWIRGHSAHQIAMVRR